MEIDDFLINYTHHQGSIQEFLSCLDRGEEYSNVAVKGEEPNQSNCDDSTQPPLQSTSSLVETSSALPPIDIDSEPSSLVFTAAAHTKHPKSRACRAAGKITCKAIHPKKTIDQKQTLTEEEKDERRRFQNREAQRRFRERHMLEAYRKASSNPAWAAAWTVSHCAVDIKLIRCNF